MKNAKSIVLVGFMGAGKSSVGRCLQRLTGLGRLDIDELVGEKFQLSIPEIFSKHGEERFRDAETELLRELSPNRPSIIVTGGGIVLRKENTDLLKRLGTIVWLDAAEEILFERATRKNDRPLLHTDDPWSAFTKLLASRRPIYENVADIQIETSNLKHEEVAEKIMHRIDNEISPKR